MIQEHSKLTEVMDEYARVAGNLAKSQSQYYDYIDGLIQAEADIHVENMKGDPECPHAKAVEDHALKWEDVHMVTKHILYFLHYCDLPQNQVDSQNSGGVTESVLEQSATMWAFGAIVHTTGLEAIEVVRKCTHGRQIIEAYQNRYNLNS